MSVCPYIRLSTTLRGKRDFLGPYWDRGQISSSFATYGCCQCHPCLFVMNMENEEYLFVRDWIYRVRYGKHANALQENI